MPSLEDRPTARPLRRLALRGLALATLLSAPLSAEVGPAGLVPGAILRASPSPRKDDPEDLARRTRIVPPEVRRAFYRSGGRRLVGQRVYLHLEASVLRRPPKVVAAPGRTPVLVFENRSVPVVVLSESPYWKKVHDQLEFSAWYAVRGRLRIPEDDPRQRVHLFVESLKPLPGGAVPFPAPSLPGS